jgi:penicillin amidase
MRSSLLLLPLVSGCALFTLAATKRSHPELEGTFAAAGAQADLTIKRDAMGVPHVRAESPEDAWYGLGYAHAQDRLFQADMNRRLATGRIAEWLGERAVNLDVFVGTMDLETRGQGMLDRASPEVKAAVKAYTVGFNAGAGSLKTLPVEYRLLGVPYEPWKEVDTTGVLFLQAWSLQENLDHELAALAFDHLSADKLDPLFDTYPNTPPIDAFWDEVRTQDVGSLTDGFKAFTGALGGRPEANAQASNNWIIGGSKTASGKPIVANDPHLVQRVPSLWYAADIQGGDLHVAGATLPGTIGFPVGHNERVAWGLTNVMADTVDLAVVERDGDTVRIEGKEETIETRTF